jgi:hypothetical protein
MEFDVPYDPRIFTYEEAVGMLPALREALLEMQAGKRRLDELRGEIRKLTPAMRSNGHAEEADDLDEQVRENVVALREEIEMIESMGILVKDIDMGLVDFPTMRDGRLVYLCWRLDEPTIEYWHETDSGFNGRQPL